MNDKTVRKIRIKIYHFVDEKEKNKTVESQFNFVAVFPVYVLNYLRLRVLTRYSTVRVLRALRREVNTGDGLFCAFPKFSLAHVHTLFREA